MVTYTYPGLLGNQAQDCTRLHLGTVHDLIICLTTTGWHTVPYSKKKQCTSATVYHIHSKQHTWLVFFTGSESNCCLPWAGNKNYTLKQCLSWRPKMEVDSPEKEHQVLEGALRAHFLSDVSVGGDPLGKGSSARAVYLIFCWRNGASVVLRGCKCSDLAEHRWS